ncbi:MAG: matrixin family metalloprotease [Fusobacterium sp.]|nr:matrixin family metalloprotease [Fusobacterium sp.]
MKLIGRLVLLICIIVAGIYCLPDGPQKLEYLLFRLFPQAKITIAPQEPAPLEVEEEVFEEEEEEEIVSSAETPRSNLHAKRAAVQNLIGKNYLDAVLSAGKLERWNPRSFPLKVYMEGAANVPPAYVQEVKNAFATWEASTNGFVKFVYTNSPAQANYKCIFAANLKNRNCDEKGLGTAAYQYFTYDKTGNIEYSIVEFSPYACNGQPWPAEIFYTMALHEIGHGLGLRGHSTDSNDLMYPVGTGSRERGKISDADMTTLRAIYSIIPDVTNIPFTDEDKKGLITSADFWGEDAQRADFTISQLKENIALTPDNPSLYVELAQAYRDKKDYNSAISAYSQALKNVDNSETATAILFDVSDLYIKMEQFQSAEKCIDKAATYGQDKYIAVFYNIIAVNYAKQKNYNKAAQVFDKALSNTQDDEMRKNIYQNYRWLGYVQKDKVMFDKYNKLLGGK